jgi:hypothetical protein
MVACAQLPSWLPAAISPPTPACQHRPPIECLHWCFVTHCNLGLSLWWPGHSCHPGRLHPDQLQAVPAEEARLTAGDSSQSWCLSSSDCRHAARLQGHRTARQAGNGWCCAQHSFHRWAYVRSLACVDCMCAIQGKQAGSRAHTWSIQEGVPRRCAVGNGMSPPVSCKDVNSTTSWPQLAQGSNTASSGGWVIQCASALFLCMCQHGCAS